MIRIQEICTTCYKMKKLKKATKITQKLKNGLLSMACPKLSHNPTIDMKILEEMSMNELEQCT